MRFVDLYNTICSGAASGADPAHERHYLQFDGVGDYAVADAVFGGISGDYTIAIKVAGKTESGSAIAMYVASGGAGSSAVAQSQRDSIAANSSFSSTLFQGYDESATLVYNYAASGKPADTGGRVLAVKRASVAANAFLRLIQSAGVEDTSDDTSATHQIPDHLAVGCRVDNALAPSAPRYGAVKLIGLVLASVEVPDAELQAWLNATTAVGNITGIDHYWCASDIDGATIPARVGTVALALSGPAVGDLVAWSP